ncbi:hypothetical protein EXE44_15520 [Halorubrum sp. SS7]|uniref:hypothetical protein n=1 Tax=Halorubrum sp. SS7 TaxID=2518119 RepID=UPI0010F8F783|nr:hypothetical protein [Halorubrum sp. SS7]TKX56306.1 hypothetical protein EXE44_15520 [Halorubrum sp. SS7]
MTDIGEAISAALILVVGAGVLAIMAGADTSLVTNLMSSGITLIVYVGVFGIFALILLNIVKQI